MIKKQDYNPSKLIPIIFIIYTMIIQQSYSWCLRTVFAGIESIQSVDFSPDGQYILTGQISGRVLLWKTDTLEIIKSYDYGNRLWQAVFSKNQAYIAIVGQHDDIHIISSSNFTQILTIPSGHGKIYDVDYRYDTKYLITCGDDKKTKMWNATDGTFIKQVTNTDIGYSCQYGDNNWFATAGHTFIETWDNNTNTNTNNGSGGGGGGGGGGGWSSTIVNYFMYTHPVQDFYCIRIKPSTDYFISANVLGHVLEGVVDSNNTYTSISGSSGGLYSCAYSRDSTYFAVAGDDSHIYMFNATSRANKIQSILKTQSTSKFMSVQFSYDSNNFLAGNQNGTVYFYQRFCHGCPVGSYQNRTQCRKCSQAMVGCSICLNSTVCKSCMSGYYVNSNVCKTCDIIEGCASCNSSTNCSTCLTGFYKNGITCVRCLTTQFGCQQCLSGTVCLECDKNTYLNGNGTCIRCTTLTHCIYCNSSTYCLECRPGYWQNNGTCIQCQSSLNPYCLVCQTETTCSSCISGYRLNSSSLCQKCLPECLFCNNTGHCFDCIERMYVSAAFVCTFCVQPCLSCNSSTYCHRCILGFYISAAGVCSNCPGGCLSCNSSTRCMSCDSGYYLDVPTHTCKRCALVSTYCRQCTDTVCLACQVQYLLLNGTCQQCTSLIPYCQVCQNTTLCDHCMTGYYASGINGNSSCHLCDQVGCSSCKSSTQCYACQPGYYITGQNCALCANKCLTCTSNLANACTSCIEGFYVSSTTIGTCVSCGSAISRCVACMNSSYCVGCNIGYYLSSATTCTACTRPCTSCKSSATDCLTCDLGFYYITGALGSCSPCNPACSQCTTSPTNCLSCVQGYYYNSTSLSCINCSITLSGCSICDSNTTCIVCASGYYLVGTICSHCSTNISKCLRCNTLGSICTLCDYGYTLAASNTSCQSCQNSLTNCQHCTSVSYCQTCKQMYYSNGGICTSCSVGCLTCYNNTLCQVCADTYIMLSTKLCQLCENAIIGCQLCTSNTVCINCIVGYYLNASVCYTCRSAMEGCQYCSDSSHCVQCSLFYQLTSNGTCRICRELYSGCQVCGNSSVGCTQCQISYFLDSAGTCQSCSNLTVEGCLKCSSNTTCTQCMAGYYLSNTTNLCIRCDISFPNCIKCNLTSCSQCQSGFYLNNGTCSACPRQGCQICFANDPNKCVDCNSRYYLSTSGDQCLLCSASIPQCLQCQTAALCIDCASGFYLTVSYQCGLCSDMYEGCQICSPSGCIDCMANFFLNTSDMKCHNCTDHIVGCSFCLSESVCISCQNGYYSINSTCQRCATIQGCLYCINQTHCSYCSQSYYLNQNDSTCYSCKDAIPGCYACASDIMCIGCYGNWRLFGGTCQEILGEVVKDYTEIGLKSYYVNSTCLKHTLFAREFLFAKVQQIWDQVAELVLIGKDYTRYPLTILKVEWSTDLKQLYFYTNNPIQNQLSQSIKNMPIIKNKLRLLQDASADLGFNLKLKLTEQATHDIMPELSHLGDLYLDYPYSDSQFYQSYMQNRKYYYYIFGLIVTIVLLVGYSIKLCCLVPGSRDRGSILPHVFAVKCGALALYPTYGEYVSFCYGFMMAEVPWFNSFVGERLGQPNDFSPQPYKMYYKNLSFVSTYFIALLIIIFIYCIITLIDYFSQNLTQKIQTYKTFLYNFFGLGAIMAGCLSLQGVILNPIQSTNANTFFYIVGIVVYLGLFVQIAYSWSISRRGGVKIIDQIGTAGHFRKIRLYIKASLLALMHMGPLYYVSAIFCIDIGAILLERYMIQQQKVSPKLELTQHILADITLLLVVLFPDALLGIIIGIILISFIVGLEFLRFFYEVNNNVQADQYVIQYKKGMRPREQTQAASITHLNQLIQQQIKNQSTVSNLLATKSNKISQEPISSSPAINNKNGLHRRRNQQIHEFVIKQLSFN